MGHSPAEHWAGIYTAKASDQVSWYQSEPSLSLRMIERSADPPARVLDVGGGASILADRLVTRGYEVGVLDISDEPLALARSRLGADAGKVEWVVADVTRFRSPRPWDVWHDRAVFHFLMDEASRRAYREALDHATGPEAAVIVATFGPQGPQRCSGLPTMRYTPEALAGELGSGYRLMDAEWQDHRTPAGATQQFVYCLLRRVA